MGILTVQLEWATKSPYRVFKLSFSDSINNLIFIYLIDKPNLLIPAILTIIIFALSKKLDISGDNLKLLLLFWLVWIFLYSSKNFPNISEGISYIVASGIAFYCIYLLIPKKYIELFKKIQSDNK